MSRLGDRLGKLEATVIADADRFAEIERDAALFRAKIMAPAVQPAPRLAPSELAHALAMVRAGFAAVELKVRERGSYANAAAV